MGRLYTRFGHSSPDVAIEQLAFGRNQDFVEDVSQVNSFQMKQVLKKFARHLKKNYVPLAIQNSDEPTGDQFYIKINGNDEWLPVVHFHWKDENKECGIDSTSYCHYVKNYKFDCSWLRFRKRWQALNRLANMVGNQ